VDAAATTKSVAPGIVTSPSVTPAPTPAAPAAVPNVTGVHTGEFWAGPLPIVLLAGMGLAGLALIGRRRIAAAVRTLHPITRRRGGP
jgi:hypothetical protein